MENIRLLLAIFDIKLFIGCKDSDGLMGFDYSHDGWWGGSRTNEGIITKMKCANTCNQECVAFVSFARSYLDDVISGYNETNGLCQHYTNLVNIASAMKGSTAKAYIKCSGRNDWRYYFKIAVLQ